MQSCCFFRLKFSLLMLKYHTNLAKIFDLQVPYFSGAANFLPIFFTDILIFYSAGSKVVNLKGFDIRIRGTAAGGRSKVRTHYHNSSIKMKISFFLLFYIFATL